MAPREVCSQCHGAWQAQGTDSAAFASINASPFASHTQAPGLAFDNASLGARFGVHGYALARLDLVFSDASASLTFPEGGIRVITVADLHPIVVALARNLSVDEAVLESSLRANSTRGTYSATLPGVPQFTPLWARLSPNLTGQEDHFFDLGDPVVAGPWSFTLSFALARVDVEDGRDTLSVEANPSGAYSALMTLWTPANSTVAQARFDAMLEMGRVTLPTARLVAAN